MEPTIEDGSIVYVKYTKDLHNNDIGIFVVNGVTMCKRYKEEGLEKWLTPDNTSSEFSPIHLDENTDCIAQGKVLL